MKPAKQATLSVVKQVAFFGPIFALIILLPKVVGEAAAIAITIAGFLAFLWMMEYHWAKRREEDESPSHSAR